MTTEGASALPRPVWMTAGVEGQFGDHGPVAGTFGFAFQQVTDSETNETWLWVMTKDYGNVLCEPGWLTDAKGDLPTCFCGLDPLPGETHGPKGCAGPGDRIGVAVAKRYGR